MVVCKFFLQGNCRFGDNCRNEHPQSGGGFGSNNRFGALQNTGSGFTNTGSKYSTMATGARQFVNSAPPAKPGTFKVPTSTSTMAPAEANGVPLVHEIVVQQAPGRRPGTFIGRSSSCSLSCQNSDGVFSDDRSASSWPHDPMFGVRFELTVVLYEGNRKREWSIEATQIEQIKKDLSNERPKWILSSYGPVKNVPASLFEGNEYSPEEIRLRFYELASKGQEAQGDQEALQLWSKAEQDINNVLNNVNEVPKFMEAAEDKHPNRFDFVNFDGTRSRDEHSKAIESTQNATQSSGFGAGTGFAQPTSNTSNPFSKPAAATFGQQNGPSPFSGGSFGKPAQSSAFGQSGFGVSAPTGASAFGQSTAATAFGKPAFGSSTFGQSGFGQTAQPAPAFGQQAQNSAFGGSGFGASNTAFGKPSQPTSTFGQPTQPSSGFGQTAQPTAFGQVNQPAFGQNAFGQARSPFGQQSAGFGQSGFGQTAQPATSSPFGQQAPPGQPATSSPFGQTSASASPFGQNTTSTGGFGQLAQNSNPFGVKPAETATPEVSMESEASNIAQPATTPANPFSQPPTSQATQPSAVAVLPNTNSSQTPHPLLGRPPHPLHYTESLPAGSTQTDMSKRLTTYRGQAVRYLAPKSESDQSNPNPSTAVPVPCYNRPDGKGPEKVWFADAGATPEVLALSREDKTGDLQCAAELYTEDVKDAYKKLFETGRFKIGKIPSVPPMRDWIAYDF